MTNHLEGAPSAISDPEIVARACPQCLPGMVLLMPETAAALESQLEEAKAYEQLAASTVKGLNAAWEGYVARELARQSEGFELERAAEGDKIETWKAWLGGAAAAAAAAILTAIVTWDLVRGQTQVVVTR